MSEFDGAKPQLHGKDSVSVRLPLVVKLQSAINKAAKADAARLRWSNLAHATTNNEVFQNPEDELLPAGGSSGKQRQAFEKAAYRSCGENRS